jgi:hypothetical protein
VALNQSDSESTLNAALRQFEAAEANLEKLERLWNDLSAIIPSGIAFGNDPSYDDRRRAYSDILRALPKIDGWKPEAEPPDLNDLAQNRLDARDVDEVYALVAVEESVEKPPRELAEYRYRFNKKRRQIVRNALSEVIGRIDTLLRTLNARFESEEQFNKRIDAMEWDELRSNIKELDMLLGGNFQRPGRWTDLARHLHFGMLTDLRDIISIDWPDIKSGITRQLYDQNEPVPVEVDDLGALTASEPSGTVAARLKWEALSAEEFERLIFALIRGTKGYENPGWLMQTTAPDRGRDLSVIRVVEDALAGVFRSRVIIQCKHWTSRSVAGADVSELKDQMAHWEPPKVDVLIIATSGRFTADAVTLIEKGNSGDRALRIEMWPESHLEHLLASRPALIAQFGLR